MEVLKFLVERYIFGCEEEPSDGALELTMLHSTEMIYLCDNMLHVFQGLVVCQALLVRLGSLVQVECKVTQVYLAEPGQQVKDATR